MSDIQAKEITPSMMGVWVSVIPGTKCDGCGEPMPSRYGPRDPRAYRANNGKLYGDSCCGNARYYSENKMPLRRGE